MGYVDQRNADAKLAILEMLRKEPNQTSREVYLQDGLLAAPHYIVRTKPAVRQLCRELEDVGGVSLREVEGVFLVTLTEAGRNHLDELLTLEGVTRIPERR